MKQSAPPVLDRFDVTIPITVRLARARDLGRLEWFGWFSPHRELIRETFDRQKRGEVLMLLACAGGFPIGQTWIDLSRKAAEGVGILWALRVLPGYQGAGIGSALIRRAESLLRLHEMSISEIGVERDNPGARRLYEQLGYELYSWEHEVIEFTTPDGRAELMDIDQWVLRKSIVALRPARPRTISQIAS